MKDFGWAAVRRRFHWDAIWDLLKCRVPILVLANQRFPSSNTVSVTQYLIVDGIGPNGNVAPNWVIAGPNTSFQTPSDVAVYEGQIFVSDRDLNAITVFPLATGGNPHTTP
jgi:hypothetical protein